MNKEADITINGQRLTYAQAMTIRVIVATSLSDFDDPDFLGKDKHGRNMVQLYKKSLNEIQDMIFENLS